MELVTHKNVANAFLTHGIDFLDPKHGITYAPSDDNNTGVFTWDKLIITAKNETNSGIETYRVEEWDAHNKELIDHGKYTSANNAVLLVITICKDQSVIYDKNLGPRAIIDVFCNDLEYTPKYKPGFYKRENEFMLNGRKHPCYVMDTFVLKRETPDYGDEEQTNIWYRMRVTLVKVGRGANLNRDKAWQVRVQEMNHGAHIYGTKMRENKIMRQHDLVIAECGSFLDAKMVARSLLSRQWTVENTGEYPLLLIPKDLDLPSSRYGLGPQGLAPIGLIYWSKSIYEESVRRENEPTPYCESPNKVESPAKPTGSSNMYEPIDGFMNPKSIKEVQDWIDNLPASERIAANTAMCMTYNLYVPKLNLAAIHGPESAE